MVEPSPTPMMPMSLERMTTTSTTGNLVLRASAVRRPAEPPPRTMIFWIGLGMQGTCRSIMSNCFAPVIRNLVRERSPCTARYWFWIDLMLQNPARSANEERNARSQTDPRKSRCGEGGDAGEARRFARDGGCLAGGGPAAAQCPDPGRFTQGRAEKSRRSGGAAQAAVEGRDLARTGEGAGRGQSIQ